ncbi:TetR/AcrR family transcriptional regulator [Mesorhizobium sp. J428]|uniref:TetR/AcrR family transcriptional regulator n=1 Tax=Mesorhizobium sp. J428 TaxID=2898440 RepID=UPI002150A023|nr:TetR/AcrR family transcriptional regulator [Mesorhizobium sp. J428]MCR5856727.1 TetR/AcrR family transcriptional regulator [Mesorhizobium sp. J428]
MDAPVVDKRERILSAASELIVKNGLQCSMAEIAQVAGVATGTLYLYFASKEEMVRGVYQRLTAKVGASLIIEHGPEVPHETRVRRYIDDYIRLIWADPEQAILFEYLSNIPLLQPGELRQLFAPVTDFTAKVFTEAHAAGVLRDFDPNVMGAYVGGGIRNTLKWRRADGSSLTEPERRQIAEMCWSAIARQQPAATGSLA